MRKPWWTIAIVLLAPLVPLTACLGIGVLLLSVLYVDIDGPISSTDRLTCASIGLAILAIAGLLCWLLVWLCHRPSRTTT